MNKKLTALSSLLDFISQICERQIDWRSLRQVRKGLVLRRDHRHFEAPFPVGQDRFRVDLPREGQFFVHFHFFFNLFYWRHDTQSVITLRHKEFIIGTSIVTRAVRCTFAVVLRRILTRPSNQLSTRTFDAIQVMYSMLTFNHRYLTVFVLGSSSWFFTIYTKHIDTKRIFDTPESLSRIQINVPKM